MFWREEEGRKNIIKVPPTKKKKKLAVFLAYYWRVTCLGKEKTHMWLLSKPLILTLAQQDRHSAEEPSGLWGCILGYPGKPCCAWKC